MTTVRRYVYEEMERPGEELEINILPNKNI